MKKAIITGVCGQTGSYMAEFLLESGYIVYGVYRRSSSPNFERLANIMGDSRLILIEGDVCDSTFLSRLLKEIQPDEVYNFAAQSHVATSFQQPAYTWEATGISVLNLLEAVRNESPHSKVYQASSSEMFGSSYDEYINPNDYTQKIKYQDENTPFLPQSPYAIAKLAGHHLVRNYRDSYNLFICSGIAFNHESPRRGENFVTRKITKWIGSYVKSGGSSQFPKLRLGNLTAYRDWSHAKDVVVAAWLMLQRQKPDDYVIASGETRSVQDFLNTAFAIAESKFPNINFKNVVEFDQSLLRPAEVDYLMGLPDKIKGDLHWTPKYTFNDLVLDMVEFDTK